MVYFFLKRIYHNPSTSLICSTPLMPPETGHFHSKPWYLPSWTLSTVSWCISLLSCLPILHSPISDLFKAEIGLVTPLPQASQRLSSLRIKIQTFCHGLKHPTWSGPCLPAFGISPIILTSFTLFQPCRPPCQAGLGHIKPVSTSRIYNCCSFCLDSLHTGSSMSGFLLPFSSSLNCHLKETLPDHLTQKICLFSLITLYDLIFFCSLYST